MRGANRRVVEVPAGCIAFEDLVEAAGGVEALALECGVPVDVVHGWLAGDDPPGYEMRLTLAGVARDLGMLPPVVSRSGPHLLVPEFVPRVWLEAGLRHAR
jgi:hypothetical protein